VNRLYELGFWRATAADGLAGGTYDITLVGHNMELAQLCPITAIKRSTSVSPWTEVGTHVAASGALDSAVIKRTGASDWSDWGFGGEDNSFLPITLDHFSATPDIKDRSVRIDWATVYEENHSYFEVERSNDLEIWNGIARVEGQGNSTQRRNYEVIDRLPQETNYYRLKSVDIDGATTFSSVVAAHLENIFLSSLAQVYPNPNEGSFSIETPGTATYRLYDMQGREIRREEFKERAKVNGLPAGIYMVRVYSRQVIESYRVIVR